MPMFIYCSTPAGCFCENINVVQLQLCMQKRQACIMNEYEYEQVLLLFLAPQTRTIKTYTNVDHPIASRTTRVVAKVLIVSSAPSGNNKHCYGNCNCHRSFDEENGNFFNQFPNMKWRKARQEAFGHGVLGWHTLPFYVGESVPITPRKKVSL